MHADATQRGGSSKQPTRGRRASGSVPIPPNAPTGTVPPDRLSHPESEAPAPFVELARELFAFYHAKATSARAVGKSPGYANIPDAELSAMLQRHQFSNANPDKFAAMMLRFGSFPTASCMEKFTGHILRRVHFNTQTAANSSDASAAIAALTKPLADGLPIIDERRAKYIVGRSFEEASRRMANNGSAGVHGKGGPSTASTTRPRTAHAPFVPIVINPIGLGPFDAALSSAPEEEYAHPYIASVPAPGAREENAPLAASTDARPKAPVRPAVTPRATTRGNGPARPDIASVPPPPAVVEPTNVPQATAEVPAAHSDALPLGRSAPIASGSPDSPGRPTPTPTPTPTTGEGVRRPVEHVDALITQNEARSATGVGNERSSPDTGATSANRAAERFISKHRVPLAVGGIAIGASAIVAYETLKPTSQSKPESSTT